MDFGRSRPRDFPADCWLSTLAVESLAFEVRNFAILSFSGRAPDASSLARLVRDGSVMSGRMSFFCLLGGRISSRSTGTPRLIRKSRRMRDWVQFGGWRGGGVMS